MIYLDYAANTPVHKEVLETYNHTVLEYFPNPNSTHGAGKEVLRYIHQSMDHIAELLDVSKEELIFTSGASESNNLVIKGIAERYRNKGKHMIVGSLEHNSIMQAVSQLKGYEIDILPVDKNGRYDINRLTQLLRDDTILVSLCSIDSEVGIRQPIEEIALLLKEKCFFHCDASQSVGKVSIDFHNVDLITLTAHKFYGLNGCGLLVKRKKIGLIPLIHGGKSLSIYRSGTPDTGGIIAFDKALSIAFNSQQEHYDYVSKLYHQVLDYLKSYRHIHINNTEYSIPYVINISFETKKSDDIAGLFEAHDIYLSTKTSCCPEHTPSKVIYALTNNRSLASSSIRISLSHLTTQEEINTFLNVFKTIYEEIYDE